MLPINKQKNLDVNGSLALKRRQLLHAGLSGAVLAMVAVATPSLAAPPALMHDFGPNYSVQNVYQLGRHTHVELGFKVNGRFFTTRLVSTDGNTWRPV